MPLLFCCVDGKCSFIKGTTMKVGIIILCLLLVLFIFARVLQWFDEERGNDGVHI